MIKLFKVLIDKTWFCGQKENLSKWIQEPVEYTDWNQDFNEAVEKYNSIKPIEDDSDGWEKRLCFMEVDENEFCKNYVDGDTELNLDDDFHQEMLNYYCNYDWIEIQVALIEFPLP